MKITQNQSNHVYIEQNKKAQRHERKVDYPEIGSLKLMELTGSRILEEYVQFKPKRFIRTVKF